jgi:hypothetical protein
MDYLDNPLPGSIAGADLRAAKKVRISTGVHSMGAIKAPPRRRDYTTTSWGYLGLLGLSFRVV